MSTNQFQWVAKALALVAVTALGLGVSTWLFKYEAERTVTPARVEHVDKQVYTVEQARTLSDPFSDLTETIPAKTETIPGGYSEMPAITEKKHPSWATPLAIAIIVLVVGGSAVLLFQPRKPDQPA
jgi:hypothetical protein